MAQEAERDRLAGPQSGDRPRERVRALDPGAVERDDHVAATQIRLGGRAALAMPGSARPFPGHGLDAEKGVRHRAAALERAQLGFGGVDRDGEADADVGVAATPVAICELMPITRPWASISGPPEFQG